MSILKRVEELYHCAERGRLKTGPIVSDEIDFRLNSVVAIYLDGTSMTEFFLEAEKGSFYRNRDIDRSTSPPTFRGKPIYRVASNISHIYVAAEPA